MPATLGQPNVDMHFQNRAPVVRAIYDRLLTACRHLGPLEQDPKKTSIHLNRTGQAPRGPARLSAFAGIATRNDALILTFKAPADIQSARIVKHQKASAHRWYLDLRLEQPDEVDLEVMRWLRASCQVSA